MFTLDFNGFTPDEYKEYLISKYNYGANVGDVLLMEAAALKLKDKFNLSIKDAIAAIKEETK